MTISAALREGVATERNATQLSDVGVGGSLVSRKAHTSPEVEISSWMDLQQQLRTLCSKPISRLAIPVRWRKERVVARKKGFGVKLVLWVIIALTVLALGYLGVGLFVADRLSAPSHHPQELTPTDVGLDYREVTIQSTDGLELAGWWVPGNGPSRAVVLAPGIEGDKSDWHVLKTASVYAGAGYGVLMIDLRAQGGSEGERVTMGYKEVRDVRGALSWLNEQGFAPGEVVLHGFSLGGATVLRAAPQSGVAAVVEESAYSDLPMILRQQLPEVSGLPSLFTPGIFLMGKLFLGIDPWAVRPEEDARRLCEEGVRLLIIHSKDDEAVPFEHAERIKRACPEAAFWKIEDYRHVGAYAHPRYRERLLNFLRTLEANEST
jgi:uncharacterized protein